MPAFAAFSALFLPPAAPLPPLTGAQTMVGYATCSDSDPLQRWDVSEPTAGEGRIRDAESGRCLTVQDCSTTHPWQPQPTNTYGIVVLDACGAGTCGGKNAEWTAATAGANTAFRSAVATDKCWLLNVVGDSPDVQSCDVAVWAFGPTCPASGSLNSEFSYVSSTSQIKVLNSDRVAKTCPDATNCCLVAKPCVHPCVLPMGWGALFLILFVAGCCGYVSAGVVYAVKVEGKDPAAGAHTHSRVRFSISAEGG